MLVPLPGSQHTLGLFIVSEFFRRGGWKVWGELAASEGEIIVALSIDTLGETPVLFS